MSEKDPKSPPDEETRAAAQPIAEDLENTLAAIDTPEEAEAVIDKVVKDTKDEEALEEAAAIPEDAPPEVQAATAAEAVHTACEAASGDVDEAVATVEAAAREAAALKGESYEAVTEAIQEVTNPELQRQPDKLKRPRRYLLDAILRSPGISLVAKIDTELFVLINVSTPRSDALDRFFSRLSTIFTGGWIYIILIALLLPFRPRWTWQTLVRISPPIWAAALVVEGPVKKYFRRQRPFIDIVRAIIVGKKPGNWSFPSGHASAAFGGAYIVSKYIPRLKFVVYPLAALVAYSRVYLGAHYPGDVFTGSLFGIGLAELTNRIAKRFWLRDESKNTGK
jgi:undecaprenyl-diphosphatase